ncbi:MAG: sugar phosphate isomerase/epimerase [Verrucomicrobia bacterium]|nr:sugar phosphate isomerase/epimerase [Verrucomicrobiota bacterium]MBI3868761.1 sugar phosphate isomerase/epimerase [Verrucomicrobiota bacterium]
MSYLQRITAALLCATALTLPCAAARAEVQLGLQSWTLRHLKFDQVVEFAVAHGIKTLQLTAAHLDPNGPIQEIQKKKEILEKNGLRVYTFGVAGTSLDKEQNRKLFEFAKLMGIRLIIVEPNDFKIFDNLEELVKEYDIRVAIHNHGIRSMYGNPAVVKNVLKHRDPRIGVCMDAGWITAAGFDAAKIFREYDGRVLDIHLKDKEVKPALGETVSADTEIGKGNANLKGLAAELKKANWNGVMAIETDGEGFALKPAPFVDGAKAWFEENVK